MPYKDKKKQVLGDRERRHRIAEYWLVDKGNKTNNALRKKAAEETEKYAETILKELGFQYILPLNNTTSCAKYINHNMRTIFPFFDYYAEKDGQKWFIDVTAYIRKQLPHTPLWERLGIKLAVIFVRRDLKQYVFREDTGKLVVELRLKDIGLIFKDLSETRKESWLTRRANGQVSWNKGLTKDTDIRIANQAESMLHHYQEPGAIELHRERMGRSYKAGRVAWNKGLTKETDERMAKIASYPSWAKGLTVDTDERIARREIASKRARGLLPANSNTEFTNVK
jgi:hypothetical protein